MSLPREKKCEDCGTPIVGRTDKRFCSDQCRNNHNNRLNSDSNSRMRSTNNVLRRNRRILLTLNTHGRTVIRKGQLLAMGFDFNHVTSLSATRQGVPCYYCYEQGYLPMKKGYFRLVIKRDPQLPKKESQLPL